MAEGRRDHLSALMSRRRSKSSTRAHKGILGIIVCIGVALPQLPSVQAQDAVPSIPPEPTVLPELSKRTGPEPMKVEATPTPVTETPSIEISAATPGDNPGAIAKQTPLPKTGAKLAAAVGKNPSTKHIIVQPKATEPTPVTVLRLSALKAEATSAPLPDYPYQAKQAHLTGSGICILVVDRTSGKVTSAKMAQSTGSQILDKVTTDAFRRWRFKPGTVAQIEVPITYE